MGSSVELVKNKPHAVCIPFPKPGHINPMLKLAKVLHHKGFHITFVSMKYGQRYVPTLMESNSVKELPSFRLETISDGLDGVDAPDTDALYASANNFCPGPFKELVANLNSLSELQTVNGPPPVSCIVSDRYMMFTPDVAQLLEIPAVFFNAINPRGALAVARCATLAEKGYLPLKDMSCMTNGYLDTFIEDIPGMEGMRLRDLPDHIVRAKDLKGMAGVSPGRVSGLVFNSFEDLECPVLKTLRSMLPHPVYTIGPLNFLEKQLTATDNKDDGLEELGPSTVWKEEAECLAWLDSKEPNSVIYVSFGTIICITSDQLVEFAWGLAQSNQPFLWMIRSDLVDGEEAILPPEFLESTKDGRGMVMEWCLQEKVLDHPSIGGFLTHCGWNSVLESISSGIPMICFPDLYEQRTVSWSICNEWGIGMEIKEARRDIVECLVRELFSECKGKEMRKRALEWKKSARDAVANGSSLQNLDKLINQVLLPPGRA